MMPAENVARTVGVVGFRIGLVHPVSVVASIYNRRVLGACGIERMGLKHVIDGAGPFGVLKLKIAGPAVEVERAREGVKGLEGCLLTDGGGPGDANVGKIDAIAHVLSGRNPAQVN